LALSGSRRFGVVWVIGVPAFSVLSEFSAFRRFGVVWF